MFVSSIMSRCVHECTEDMGLTELYDLLRMCDHGLVVVVDSHAHRVPIGVVNERSICEQIIARGRNPRTLIAGSVMNSRIVTILESERLGTIDTTDLDDVAAIIVTNDERQVTGLIPKSSFSRLRRPVLVRNTDVAAREVPAFGWIQ